MESLPVWLTLTRSGNGSYFDSGSILRTVGTNISRFDHVLGTGANLGLLLEGSVQNLILRSDDQSNASWTKLGTTVVTSAGAGTAPDGVKAAYTFNVEAAGQGIRQLINSTAGAVGSQTAYVKASASGGAANIRLTTNNTLAWNTGVSTKTALTSSWIRAQNVGVFNSSGTTAYLIFGASDVSGSSDATCYGNVDIAFIDGVAAAFPTSHIATDAGPVTRNADSVALSSVYASNPVIVETMDIQTLAISRTLYSAGAFSSPSNVWLRSMAIYPPTSSPEFLNSKLTVGVRY